MSRVTTEELYSVLRECSGMSTDSRRVEPGAMFFALRGDNFDGNRYAAGALASGAAYCVVDDPDVAVSERYLLVDDVLSALQAVAREHRRRLGIPILGITGSNGKTTTKELLSRVLAKKFRVSVTRGNLNNHIGVPLTLLAMGDDTEFGIVEMGASHCGEIALLCSIAEPDYGLITNIGRAHLEGFGGPEGVERGKGEMFDFLAATGGMAFYLEDSEALRRMASGRGKLRKEPYSSEGLTVAGGYDTLTVEWGGRKIFSSLVGDYNIYNIAAAISVGRYFGITDDDIVAAIESYVPDNNRSQSVERGSNRLILDYYNANPSSMRAAVANFAAMPSDLRRVAVLGDMLELGEYSLAEHVAIISLLAGKGITTAYFVGAQFAAAGKSTGYRTVSSAGTGTEAGYSAAGIPDGAGSPAVCERVRDSDRTDAEGVGHAACGMGPATDTLPGGSYDYRFFADSAVLAAFLHDNPLSGALVLVKGSRGIHLEECVDALAGV